MKTLILFLSLSLALMSCGGGGSASTHAKLDPAIPKAKMNDGDLEKRMVDWFNERGWDEKFHAAVIVSEDYYYKKSGSGRVTDRWLKVLMVSKKPDGTCMYQDFMVGNQNAGGDKYGKALRSYGVGDQVTIECTGI